MQNISDQLKPILESHLFSAFKDFEINELEKSLKKIQINSGEYLFREGDPATNFYYVVAGEVKLFKTSSASTEKVIEICQAGDFFAEATVFIDPQVYPVSAQALSKCELISANSQEYLKRIHNSPETCFRLLKTLSIRLHDKVQEINHLALENSTYRLVYFLLVQYENCKKSEEDASVCLTAPKKVIASRLSIKPETLSRILAKLKKEGIIKVEKQNVILEDIQALKDYI